MPSVIFDYTRVVSALGQSPELPKLTLSNLAKLVEAIVLYDVIYTTEEISTQFEHERSVGRIDTPGFFDFKKEHIYDPIFLTLFRRAPYDVTAEVEDRIELSHPRRQFGRVWVPEADIAILHEAMSMASDVDFQNLWETRPSVDAIFHTLGRIRTLTGIAGQLGVPYDPIASRIPLIERTIPGNLTKMQLGPYRQFERDLEAYITHLIQDRLGIEFPLMLAIVLRECRAGSPDDIFANALQLRSDPIFIRFREILAEHMTAYIALDLQALAKTDRLVRSEIGQLKSRLSGELPSEFKLTLKPGLFPLAGGWEVKTAIQRWRDRHERLPIVNLSRLAEKTLRSLGTLKEKIRSVLPLEV
jgi:hypothetical protein